MAKYYGTVGFIRDVEKPNNPSVYVKEQRERKYYGDVIKNVRRWDRSENVNDDLALSIQISIVADSFALDNMYAMKYVSYAGRLWKITDISIESPRLVLSIGGLYHGQQTRT